MWDRSIGDLSHSLSLLSLRLERMQVEEKAWRALPVSSGESAVRRSVYPARRSANRKDIGRSLASTHHSADERLRRSSAARIGRARTVIR